MHLFMHRDHGGRADHDRGAGDGERR
jgi:hypothetical protein